MNLWMCVEHQANFCCLYSTLDLQESTQYYSSVHFRSLGYVYDFCIYFSPGYLFGMEMQSKEG
jgi:hypothetical protein